jgi:hypothetical protein
MRPVTASPFGRPAAPPDALEAAAIVCEATARHIRREGQPSTADVREGHGPAPLRSYTDLVVLDGVEYRIDIRPHVRDYPGCAQAEVALGGDLLDWKEKGDRWDGYTRGARRLHVATVQKRPRPGQEAAP